MIYNPYSGTVVDSGIVQNDGDQHFDFFMVPHDATVATARPVHFKVVYNSTSLNKDQIELSTYHLCFGYYGFGGPVKMPQATMYA
jgi:hypothetical protein